MLRTGGPVILLLRHGETEWNRDGRIQGRADAPLTERGAQQATAVAATVAGLVAEHPGAWRLVASPIGRARRTADIVASVVGLPVAVDDQLVELGCGAWEGCLYDEVARANADHFRLRWLYGAPDGGETYDEVHARATSWLAGLPPEPERRVIAVGHGAWGRHLRGAYAGLGPEAVLRLPVPHDAVFRLVRGDIELTPSPPQR